MVPSMTYLMTTPANARLSICAPAQAIGMSSIHLYFFKPFQVVECNTLTADCPAADDNLQGTRDGQGVSPRRIPWA